LTAYVAFLDQVAMGQAVAQVLARDRHDEAQVGHHQLAGGVQVVVVAQAAGGLLLLLQREQRQAVDRGNVGVQVAQGRHERPRIRHGDRAGGGGGNRSKRVGHVNPPQVSAKNISTL
jgi:hypothetical protein